MFGVVFHADFELGARGSACNGAVRLVNVAWSSALPVRGNLFGRRADVDRGRLPSLRTGHT